MATFESKFINASQIKVLGEWLNRLGKYELCWTSRQDTYGFYKGCGGKKETISIVRDYYNKDIVIGAFTDVAWKSKLEKQI